MVKALSSPGLSMCPVPPADPPPPGFTLRTQWNVLAVVACHYCWCTVLGAPCNLFTIWDAKYLICVHMIFVMTLCLFKLSKFASWVKCTYFLNHVILASRCTVKACGMNQLPTCLCSNCSNKNTCLQKNDTYIYSQTEKGMCHSLSIYQVPRSILYMCYFISFNLYSML